MIDANQGWYCDKWKVIIYSIIHQIMELKWVRRDLYPHLSNWNGTIKLSSLSKIGWDQMSSLVKLYGTICPPMSKMAWDQLSMGSIVLQSFIPLVLRLSHDQRQYNYMANDVNMLTPPRSYKSMACTYIFSVWIH